MIKENANQKYTSDAMSRGIFTNLLKMHNLPYQTFANRSDSVGGSTLGNLSNIQISMHCVDVGLAQLAMHSSYETMGEKDIDNGINSFKTFYNVDIDINDEGVTFNEGNK